MAVYMSINNNNMKGSFMKVEDVLRYLKKNVLALPQYKLDGVSENHFFKCTDVSEKIGAQLFRVMECDVVQFVIL